MKGRGEVVEQFLDMIAKDAHSRFPRRVGLQRWTDATAYSVQRRWWRGDICRTSPCIELSRKLAHCRSVRRIETSAHLNERFEFSQFTLVTVRAQETHRFIS